MPFPCFAAVLLLFAAAPQAPSETIAAADASGTAAVLEWQRHLLCGGQYYEERQLALAEKCFESALVIAERLSADDFRRGVALTSLGTVLLEQGRMPEAERAAIRAVEAFRKCGAERCGLDLAKGLRNLALVYRQENRFFEAERVLVEALALYTRARAGGSNGGRVLTTLGWLEFDRSRPAAAESYFRQALLAIQNVDDAQTRADTYAGLSAALLDMNRGREAVEAAQKALAFEFSAPVVRPSQIVLRSCSLAVASSAAGDYVLAERSLIRAQEILSNAADGESSELGVVLTAFGNLRFLEGRFTEAAQFQSRALELLGRHLSADHPQMLRLKAYHAIVLRKLKRKQEAKQIEQELRGAAQRTAVDPGSEHRISVPDLLREEEHNRNRKP